MDNRSVEEKGLDKMSMMVTLLLLLIVVPVMAFVCLPLGILFDVLICGFIVLFSIVNVPEYFDSLKNNIK